jgi:hypothetical protein
MADHRRIRKPRLRPAPPRRRPQPPRLGLHLRTGRQSTDTRLVSRTLRPPAPTRLHHQLPSLAPPLPRRQPSDLTPQPGRHHRCRPVPDENFLYVFKGAATRRQRPTGQRAGRAASPGRPAARQSAALGCAQEPLQPANQSPNRYDQARSRAAPARKRTAPPPSANSSLNPATHPAELTASFTLGGTASRYGPEQPRSLSVAALLMNSLFLLEQNANRSCLDQV